MTWTDVAVDGEGTALPTEVSTLDVSGGLIRGLRLTGARVYNLRAVDAVFEDCELSGAGLADAALNRVRFRNCRLSGVNLSSVGAKNVLLVDCRADDANLRLSSWEGCELADCDLRNADLSEATLTSSAVLRCDLREADLTGARLYRVALHGSRLDDIRGAESLRGAVIGTDQVLPLSGRVFAALGITIDDDYLEHG